MRYWKTNYDDNNLYSTWLNTFYFSFRNNEGEGMDIIIGLIFAFLCDCGILFCVGKIIYRSME